MPIIRINNGPNKGMVFEIESDVLGMGRDDSEDIQIYDQGVSRKHAEIFRVGEMYFIRDLGSKNGTIVNGEKISEELLRAGDTIRIGGAILEFNESPRSGNNSGQKRMQIEGEPSDGDTVNLSATGFYKMDVAQNEDAFEEGLEDPMDEGSSQESRDLKMIYDVARTIGECQDVASLRNRVLKFTVNAVRGDQGYIFVKDNEKKELILEASYEREGKKKPAISRGIIKKVIKTQRALLISDATQDERFRDNVSVMMKNIRSVLCAPLVAFEELNGVVYITRASLTDTFQREDLELVTTIGIQTGIALQTFRLAADQRQLFYNSIKMMMAASEMRTASPGHSERVANYATAIAFTLGMKKNEIKRVQLAALLHNIGRLAIPDSEVTEEPQNREEHVEYKQAETAERLIEDEYPVLTPLLPGIKYHCEHFDGTGYPEELEGEEIPLPARIIAVAKAFARLYVDTENRESVKEALISLQKLGGVLYDKSIIQALIISYRSGHLFNAANLLKS